jgi:hypothetical protein
MAMQQVSYKGLIGSTYSNAAISVSGDRSVNLFVEVVESGTGKNNVFLRGTAGLKKLVSAARTGQDTLPDQPIRCAWAGSERLFVVAGATVFEVFPDWTYRTLGTVLRDNAPAQIFANGNQLFIVSGGQGYTTASDVTGTLSLQAVIPATTGEYLDTYFIAQTPSSSQYQLSKSLDGLTWDPLDFATKESDAFHIVSTLTDHQLLILFGERSIEFWQNVGGADFPLQRVDGGVIEQGCGAVASPARIGTGRIAWLGYDSRGEGIVWAASSYQPERISNHCVETALQGYRKAGARLDNCVGIAKQLGGHHFYELHVPDANQRAGATWVYDDTASGQLKSPQWHERLAWDTEFGNWKAHWGRTHCYVFGKHIVGDYRNGNLYEESFDYFDDDGTPLRAMRSAPHLHNNGSMVFYGALWMDCVVGDTSNLMDGNGNPRPPQMMRQISNDGGRRWGEELWVGMGMTGEYRARARWTRGGRARDRCDRFVITDPIQRILINAELECEVGLG